MNIAVLSRGANLYSTKSLTRAGEKRNHVMEVLDPDYCQMTIENGLPKVYYQGEPVENLHAVIPRIGASNTYFGASLVRHFQAMGIFTIATSEAIINSRDKWSCFQVLSGRGVAVPSTAYVNSLAVEYQLEKFGHLPVIIKLLEGTHGQGVILADTHQNALATMELLSAAGVRYLLQEYIAESRGSDIRAIVVDGVVVAAMRRQSKAGDFRSNLHRGGTSENIKLSDAEEYLAIKAAKALGLGVCGVDILQSERGPLVLEVNSTPGLEGIESTSGKNISKSIIGFIERNKP